jgi:hypothetical protein
MDKAVIFILVLFLRARLGAYTCLYWSYSRGISRVELQLRDNVSAGLFHPSLIFKGKARSFH